MKECSVIITIVLLFSLCLYVSINAIADNIVRTFEDNIDNFEIKTVILDAGHGGEDGGAIASDGTLEKDLNLEIVRKIALFFDIFGIEYQLTRDGDYSIGDNTLDTIRKRKNSDITKRYEMVNSVSGSVLLSIHQNYFSVEKYSGTQVFYAPDCKDSECLASFLQNSIAGSLQPDNKRKIKESNKSIYLLYKAQQPSVLVECGFMSNNNELLNLKSGIYQSQLAYFVLSGMIKFQAFQKENIYVE